MQFRDREGFSMFFKVFFSHMWTRDVTSNVLPFSDLPRKTMFIEYVFNCYYFDSF